ncbi:SRPBCC domain-containing protein [Rhodophyticola porphyridii]|uniref:Polyketide cyclase n=1 Tax=Rhodophyticola porphyridii TaxID=1852017 RepID=A0A3L9Y9N2_9RHOB|nr:SRPBCC domain-containing protein [Rhodophyticola porphyridii]RMA43847.1 polyketide cyclase [Rhodophyticola porphyridii]
MPDFDADADLEIERLVRAAPEVIWRCWGEPDLFRQWFTPPGVEVTEVENDLRSGGRAFVVMKLPDGTLMPSEGCFFLAEPYRRLVYGDAVRAGFRPGHEIPFMTADITLTPQKGGTLYRAHVMHNSAEARRRHEDMGFADGWATTLAQLDELASGLS